MKNYKTYLSTFLVIFFLTVKISAQPYGSIVNARMGTLTNGKISIDVNNLNLSFQGNSRMSWPISGNGYMGDLSFMFSGLIPLDTLIADKNSAIIKNYRTQYGRYVFPSTIISNINGRPVKNREEAPNGDAWTFGPVAGFFNENQSSVAISTKPETWPSAWTEYPFVFKKDFKYSAESYYVMDDNPDYEFNQPPYNYIPTESDPSRKGTGILVETNVVLPDGIEFTFAKDVMFIKNKVTNISDHDFEQFNFGYLWGSLIGLTGLNSYNEWDDDVTQFEPVTSTLYSYDFDNDVSRNPYWYGKKVGYIGMRLIKGPLNDFNGIDDDRNETVNGRLFTSSDFSSKTVKVGDTLVTIDNDYKRSLHVISNATSFKLITRGLLDSVKITPGITQLVEGDYTGKQINKNAFDGIDNDFDGIIDENYLLHYKMVSSNEGFSYFLPTRYIDFKSNSPIGNIDLNDNNHFYSMNYFAPSGNINLANDYELFNNLRTFSAPLNFSNNKPVDGEDGDALVSSIPFNFSSKSEAEYVTVLAFGNDYNEMMKNLDNAEKLWNDEFKITSDPIFYLVKPDTVYNTIDQHFSWSVLNKTITNEIADIYLTFPDGSEEFLKSVFLNKNETNIDFSKYPPIMCQLEFRMVNSTINSESEVITLFESQQKPLTGKTVFDKMNFQVNVNQSKVVNSDHYKFIVSKAKYEHGVYYYGSTKIDLINSSKNEIVKRELIYFKNTNPENKTDFTTELINGYSLSFSSIPDLDFVDKERSFIYPDTLSVQYSYRTPRGNIYLSSDSLFNIKVVPGIDTSIELIDSPVNITAKKTNFIVLNDNGKQLDFVYTDGGVKGVLDRTDEIRVLYKGDNNVIDGVNHYGIPNTNYHYGLTCLILSNGIIQSIPVDSIITKISYGLTQPLEINIDPSVLLSVQNNKPQDFSISEVYPNPFNPSTNINITTGSIQGNYNFKVYDLLGRLVFSESKILPSNSNYLWQWKSNSNLGGQVTSGMYLIEVSTSSAKVVKKAMLVK